MRKERTRYGIPEQHAIHKERKRRRADCMTPAVRMQAPCSRLIAPFASAIPKHRRRKRMRKKRTRSGTPSIPPIMQSANAAVRTARRSPKERKRLCSPLVTAIAVCQYEASKRRANVPPDKSEPHSRSYPEHPARWPTCSASLHMSPTREPVEPTQAP